MFSFFYVKMYLQGANYGDFIRGAWQAGIFQACKANKDIYDISNIAFNFEGVADGTYDDSLIININLINQWKYSVALSLLPPAP